MTDIPLTTWSRPLQRPLREAGQPHPGNGQALWRLTPGHETYQQLNVSPSRKTTMAACKTKE